MLTFKNINIDFVLLFAGHPGKYYNHIRKHVDCPSLFTNENLDKMSQFELPPDQIPKFL
jgi:hypothetical protein